MVFRPRNVALSFNARSKRAFENFDSVCLRVRALERGVVFRARRENHVAAVDERLDLLEAELLEMAAQRRHRHHVSANVDGSQKCESSRHRLRSEIAKSEISNSRI